ncbi:MAG: TIGR03435 family protein, partial [Terriglobus sp.]
GRSGWWCLAQALRRSAIAGEQRLRLLLLPFWFSVGFAALYPLWQRLYAPAAAQFLMRYRGTVQWPGSAVLELAAGVLPAVMFVWVGVFLYGVLRHRSLKLSPVVAMLSLNVGAFLLFTVMMLRLHALHNDLRVLSHTDFYYPVVPTHFSLLVLLSVFGAVVVLPRERRRVSGNRVVIHLLSRCGLLNIARTVGLFTLLVPQVCAQSIAPQATTRLMGADGKPIEFDVVSIKPSHAGTLQMGIGSAPISDSLSITNMPPENIIQWAFGIFLSDQIVGLPEWARQERYDVEAKVSDKDVAAYRTVIDPIQRTPMLQKILVDRFSMTSHYETRTLSVYVLTVGK